MVRLQGNRGVDVLSRKINGLFRQAVHEVDVHMGKPSLRCHVYGLQCLQAVVYPAQAEELCIAETLHTQRESIHTGAVVITEAGDICRTRVGL